MKFVIKIQGNKYVKLLDEAGGYAVVSDKAEATKFKSIIVANREVMSRGIMNVSSISLDIFV